MVEDTQVVAKLFTSVGHCCVFSTMLASPHPNANPYEMQVEVPTPYWHRWGKMVKNVEYCCVSLPTAMTWSQVSSFPPRYLYGELPLWL